MNPDLKLLIQLQELDLRILELDKQIQQIPTQIRQLQAAAEAAGVRLAALREELTEKQKLRRKTELDVEALRAKLSRLKEQLMAVKTNKEYTAMLKEIEVCSGEIRKGEDKILELMEGSETLESGIREAEAEVDRETGKTASERKALEDQIAAGQETIQGLAAERTTLEGRIARELLRQYRKISGARKGFGLAEARDECCMGCRVRMRPQIFNEVRKMDSILTCDSCGRILYWVAPQAPAGSAAEPSGTPAASGANSHA